MEQDSVAITILKQLGGRKFLAMTGAAHLTAHPNKLTFKLGRNKAGGGYMEIELMPSDTYKLTIEKISRLKQEPWLKRTVVASRDGVYADSLQAVFTSLTGLQTSLGTMRAGVCGSCGVTKMDAEQKCMECGR